MERCAAVDRSETELMKEFPRPRVLVSRCIGFDPCRWNGLMIRSDVVRLLKPFVDFCPVCAEVEIGLGVPREPVRIVERDDRLELYQPATDTYWTEAMESFSARFLDGLPEIDGAILKSRSPSCGMKDVKVYPSSPNSMPRKAGVGLFAAAVMERLGGVAIEDEDRLTNFVIREQFLTRLFASASFRRAKAEGTMGALLDYHTRNKLLLMAYREELMRAMGRIVANHEHKPLDEVYRDYEAHLQRALSRPPRLTASINVLQHALGYFFEGLLDAEKEFFLERLDDYREGRAPLSVPRGILRSWVVRFDQEYLRDQTFFEPYPEELAQITESGKGSKL